MTNKEKGTTPPPELPESVVTLIGKFNAAIEAVARRSDEIGEEEWYEATALADMHHISGADAELIVLCSPANLHVLTTYAADSVRAANARAEGLEADARRYRWLRKHRSTNLIISFFGSGCINKEMEDVDAAIDAAQAVRSEAGEGDNDG